MKFRPVPNDRSGLYVGRYRQYEPQDGVLHPNSELIVVEDARDANDNQMGSFVIPRRFTGILPDDYVSMNVALAVAPYADPGFDGSKIAPPYVYVRIIDGFSHAGSDRLKAGWISEVVATPLDTRPPLPWPSVGEFIYHYPPHTFHERDGYAFVLTARPLNVGHSYTFPARAVPVM